MDLEVCKNFAAQAQKEELHENYYEACLCYIRAVHHCVSGMEEENNFLRANLTYEAETMLSRTKFIITHLKESHAKSEIANGEIKCKEENKPNQDISMLEIKKRLEGIITIEKPNVPMDSVVGMLNAKQALREALLVPCLFPGTGQAANAWTGILLFGASGVGKTLLVKAVATEAQQTFISLKLESVLSKWFGETEKAIAAVVEMAQENSPCILFIDEVDSLCSTRNSEEAESGRRLKNALLLAMDKMSKKIGADGKTSHVTVIGNTNLPQDLDNAFRRRFPKRIFVPLPSPKERKELITLELLKYDHELSRRQIKKLASLTDRYSGYDIITLITAAGMVQMKKTLKNTSLDPDFDKSKSPIRPIKWKDIVFAKFSTPPTNDMRTLSGIRIFNRKFGDRTHCRLPKRGQGGIAGVKSDVVDAWDSLLNDLSSCIACCLCFWL